MDKLKEMLRSLNLGRESKKIEIQAYSLDKAIAEGCKKLNATIDEIEYEVLEYGSKGFFGINKKPYKILIYKVIKEEEVEAKEEELAIGENLSYEPVVNPDGKFFVILSREGIMLKVVPPTSSDGIKIKYRDVINYLKSNNISDYYDKLVKTVVSKQENMYVSIGPYDGIEESSAKAQVSISTDEMKASIVVYPPKAKGFEFLPHELKELLDANGVIKGIIDSEIERICDEKIYYKQVTVAKGKKAKDGDDAKLKYYFDMDQIRNAAQNIIKSNKYDIKHLSKKIINVIKGDLLVEKIPYSLGEDGYTVTGKILKAKPGKDRKIPAGENTILSEDGLQLRAAIDGHVFQKRGRIHVEPVKHIQGNVNIKVGNIVFVGSVVVHGSVEDGMSVKAKGNIEVRGSVGKAELVSDEDIYIAQGIAGKTDAYIRASGNIFAKFVENANVFAGKSVIVDDHLLHSNVEANEYIVCFGRRAQIAGGRTCAGFEINTRTLGAISYTETIAEVGIFPEVRKEFESLIEQVYKSMDQIDDLKRDITTLEMQKKTRKNWNEEKEKLLNKKQQTLVQLEEAIKNMNERRTELQKIIEEAKIDGKVCVKTIVYPGVTIKTANSEFEVTNELRTGTFYEKDGEIKIGPYEDAKLEKKYYDRRILSLRGKLTK